jgi:hypothetical protein
MSALQALHDYEPLWDFTDLETCTGKFCGWKELEGIAKTHGLSAQHLAEVRT